MNILHLTTFLQGGAGRIIVDLVAAQRRAGHDVSVVASRTGVPGYDHYQVYLGELDRLGASVLQIDSTFVRDAAANLAVVGALDAEFPIGREPAVIHAHAGVPSAIALMFAAARRTPLAVVQTMHGWGIQKTDAQAAADVAVMNLVDRVVVPSRHAAGELWRRGVAPDKVHVVPYGVGSSPGSNDDPALVDLIRARRAGAFVVACVGTIGARKNQQLLVQAIARLPRRLRLYCVVVGDGDVEALRTAVAAASLQDRIHVLGYRPGARRFAALADALVLPSLNEGQPIAVLEAFQDGALVIVSDIPELTELVDAGVTGLTFTSEDADALAATLQHAATLPNAVRRAIRTRAHATHLEQFSAEAMARRYHAIYLSALGTTPGEFRPPVSPAA